MKTSFWRGLRGLIYAYTKCDEHEHLLCDNGHEQAEKYWEESGPCPECGAEIKVQLERAMHRELALGDMRRAVFPYRLYGGSIDDPDMELTWYWRRWKLFTRRVPNIFGEGL